MPKKPVLTTILIVLASLCALLTLGGAAWAWTNSRRQPAAQDQALFKGITYRSEVRQSPRSMVIHVVSVDLRQPGISFLITPGNPKAERSLNARTTSQFLEEFHLQLAINGDGFTPWHSNGLVDYYPHSGDPVEPIGFAASQGTVYSKETDNEPVLYLSRTNQARFNSPTGKIYNAISGNSMLVEQGKALAFPDEGVEPRTAVALDRRGKRLILVVVDGRQSGYSEGATLQELADIIVQNGGYTAINLDGGGSSTLVMEGKDGKPLLLNTPIDNHIPGIERPVGNHLGIYAQR